MLVQVQAEVEAEYWKLGSGRGGYPQQVKSRSSSSNVEPTSNVIFETSNVIKSGSGIFLD